MPPGPQDPLGHSPTGEAQEKTSPAGQAKPAPSPAPPAPAPVAPAPAPTPGQIDIDQILLPKKEVPGTTLQSAQRVSAGVLLNQEQTAAKEGLPQAPASAQKPPAPEKPKEESVVQPLETYQGAIEHVMQGGNVSIVSIATAEAQRRAQKGREKTPEVNAVPLRDRAAAFIKKFSMIAAGVLLLAVAVAAIAYVALRPTTVPVATAPIAPFISVDDTKSVVLAPGGSGRTLLNSLDTARKNVSLSLGLIERLIPAVASTTDSGETTSAMDARAFLSTVAPNLPTTLLRTIRPTYLLGVHVYDSNQPFLILSVDSYQDAFSGMLSWEYWMRGDLAPLFNYMPSPRINTQAHAATATTTATSSEPAVPAPVVPDFIDKIVENHDARVLQNDAGDIYLLWTFLDRNTLVITTNPATLREIISLLKQAPVTTVPAQ